MAGQAMRNSQSNLKRRKVIRSLLYAAPIIILALLIEPARKLNASPHIEIYLGMLSVEDSADDIALEKLAAALEQYPYAKTFEITWQNPPPIPGWRDGSGYVKFDRTIGKLSEAREQDNRYNGVSYSKVTDAKIFAIAKANRSWRALHTEHGCPELYYGWS